MILLVSEKVTLEYIYVIVERLLKEDASYLTLKNEQNQDALYLAARKVALDPVVASYIAEALIRGKQDVNVVSFKIRKKDRKPNDSFSDRYLLINFISFLRLLK